jgi:GH24 family phage-related lysozyme (muramidase)
MHRPSDSRCATAPCWTPSRRGGSQPSWTSRSTLAGHLQTSTLRRRVNQRDWTAAARELRRWVYGGGKVLPGLVTRRETEAMLFLQQQTT